MSFGSNPDSRVRIDGEPRPRQVCVRGSILALLRYAALALVVAARLTWGQQTHSEAAEQLRLATVYELVMHDSPRVAAGLAGARAAAARVPSASLPPDPQLQLGFMNYELPSLRPMAALGMTQLQLMQMIPVAGQLGLSGRIARVAASAESERASEVAWQARNDAAVVFYDIYRSDRRLAVARETLRLLQDLRRTAEAMYRVGEGRQVDVLRAQVEIARMVEDTIRIATLRTGMAARLNALLDREADAGFGAPALPAFPDSVPSLDSLIALAEGERPLVRAGAREVEAAQARTKLARREIWPDLQVGVQYGQRGGVMGTERMGSLMIGASLPIFAGKRQLQMREEAAAMRQMAAADLAALRADTRGRVVAAYADLCRARRLQDLYRGTVLPQAAATVESAMSAYRVGGVDFMTLLDDQMTVNRYRQELATLESEEGTAWSELEMLVGHSLIDASAVAQTAAAAGAVGVSGGTPR